MPNYPLSFRRGVSVPPRVRVGVTLERTSDRDKKAKGGGLPAPECPECPDPGSGGSPCPEIFLPAGQDMYADAPEIPVSEYHDLISLPTYNRLFTTESGEPEAAYADDNPCRSAWWKFFIKNGETWYLNADLQLSFWERNGYPDTELSLYFAAEPYELDDGLSSYIRTTDSTAESSPGVIWYSFPKMFDVELHGNASGDEDGTWFYLQAKQWANPDDDIGGQHAGVAYVLRVSLTRTAPAQIPTGAEDPDMYPPDPPDEGGG